MLVRALLITLLLSVWGASPASADSDPVGMWPLDPQPVVVAAFDPPSSPFGNGHRGVDLAARPGAWIRSSLAGQVSFIGVIAGRGVVVVDHGATRTTYEPVAGVVAVGATVTAGQVIGVLELAGSHCLPSACLHWGWIRGSTYLDPLRLVGGPPGIRLLPWSQPPAMVVPRAVVAMRWTSLVMRWAQALGCACW
jgi:murein DD-endopeptidase MepM/ murein hydrolase activator NlpD